jgi:hypothetical protein
MFRNSEDKRVQEEAAKAEVERLCGLPVADLAADVMPVFGPDGPDPKGGNGVPVVEVMSYAARPIPRGDLHLMPLAVPVREAMQALEHASLISLELAVHGGRMHITRLGRKALAEGNVRRYLDGRAAA